MIDGLSFSPEDADLLMVPWYRVARKYAGQIRRPKAIYAHRVVMSRVVGRELGTKDVVDHINGNPLDNRRENLRLGTQQQNIQNRRKNKSSTSGHRGVTWQAGKWVAQVKHNGVRHYLGRFVTAVEAAAVSAAKRRELGFAEGVIE